MRCAELVLEERTGGQSTSRSRRRDTRRYASGPVRRSAAPSGTCYRHRDMCESSESGLGNAQVRLIGGGVVENDYDLIDHS